MAKTEWRTTGKKRADGLVICGDSKGRPEGSHVCGPSLSPRHSVAALAVSSRVGQALDSGLEPLADTEAMCLVLSRVGQMFVRDHSVNLCPSTPYLIPAESICRHLGYAFSRRI
ncbi:hypothetical protein JZ751_028147 [Albula glossodonta]|uniref:Uncharacterized protein n=1 Tax=Albula glossodonta TaxID=121402 RepID=A0A8T2PBU0_9TELE|nr:hypothetical protein JZ751_028147 [Albula glossodonta]